MQCGGKGCGKDFGGCSGWGPCGVGGKGGQPSQWQSPGAPGGFAKQASFGGAGDDSRSRSPMRDGGMMALGAAGKYGGAVPQANAASTAATSKASGMGFAVKGGMPGGMPGPGGMCGGGAPQPGQEATPGPWAAAAMKASMPKAGQMPHMGGPGQMQMPSGASAKGSAPGPMPGGCGCQMSMMSAGGGGGMQNPQFPMGMPAGLGGMSKSSGAPPVMGMGQQPGQQSSMPMQQAMAKAGQAFDPEAPVEDSRGRGPQESEDPLEAKDREMLAKITATLLQSVRATEDIVTKVSQGYTSFLSQVGGDPAKAEAMMGSLDALDKMIAMGEEKVKELGGNLSAAIQAAKQLKTEVGASQARTALEQVQTRLQQFMHAVAETKMNRQQLSQKLSVGQAVKDLLPASDLVAKEVAAVEEAIALTSLEKQESSVVKELKDKAMAAAEKVKQFAQVLAQRKAASADAVRIEMEKLNTAPLEERLRELEYDIKLIERESSLVDLRETVQKKLQKRLDDEKAIIEKLRQEVGPAAATAALAGAGPGLLGLLAPPQKAASPVLAAAPAAAAAAPALPPAAVPAAADALPPGPVSAA